jgi:hypothetical protein
MCDVVIQVIPEDSMKDLARSSLALPIDTVTKLSAFVYNFSQKSVSGRLKYERCEGPETVTIPAMGRVGVHLTVHGSSLSAFEPTMAKVVGDFGPSGRTIFAFQCVANGTSIAHLSGPVIDEAAEAAKWVAASGGGISKLYNPTRE